MQVESSRGITVFFTGLSASGKSTLAKAVAEWLEGLGRLVSVLDGDYMRQYLFSDLGFSKKDRDCNVRRVGFVAAEITKHKGIAICSLIAPYDAVRKEVRSLVEEVGDFVLIYLSTALDVCESRDPKGLYARARGGEILHFTGVSDPYELPRDAELVIDTDRFTVSESLLLIQDYLSKFDL